MAAAEDAHHDQVAAVAASGPPGPGHAVPVLGPAELEGAAGYALVGEPPPGAAPRGRAEQDWRQRRSGHFAQYRARAGCSEITGDARVAGYDDSIEPSSGGGGMRCVVAARWE
jgi:hypothetical protein